MFSWGGLVVPGHKDTGKASDQVHIKMQGIRGKESKILICEAEQWKYRQNYNIYEFSQGSLGTNLVSVGNVRKHYSICSSFYKFTHLHVWKRGFAENTSFLLYRHTFIFDDSSVKLLQTFSGYISERYVAKSVPGLISFSHKGFYCC